jgi:VWFA-related protein
MLSSKVKAKVVRRLMPGQRAPTLAVVFAIAFCLATAGGSAQKPSQQAPAPAQAQAGSPNAPPQDPAQKPQQPTFRTGINFVRVDVIVTDRNGSPVNDLTQADFEIQEDGKPQTIETFKLVEITGIPKPGEELPREIRSEYEEEYETGRDDVRLFVIFLDDYHVRLGTSVYVRRALETFINTQIGPMDLVALMYPLTPTSALKFSRNRDTLVGAVQKFTGRKYDYTPRNNLEQTYAFYPAQVVERIRNEVTITALESLATHLGSLREGRKAVILVSEGFTNLLPPQLRDPIADMPGMNNPYRNQPSAGQGDAGEARARWLSSVDLLDELRSVYDAANKNNTAIYALDPRGLATNEFGIGENVGLEMDRELLNSTLDTLRILADNTDGRAIINRNDLEVGLKQVVRDSSAYYLIGYNSSRTEADGKFHDIKVRLKRPGLQVRARKGYWALTVEDLKRATAPPPPPVPPAVNKALNAIAEPPRGRLIRSWVGVTRGENGKTRMSFVWEPLPPVGGLNRFQPSQVTLTATGPNNSVYFRGRVPKDDPVILSERPVDKQGNLGDPVPLAREPSRVEFDVVPGAIELRIAVLGRGTDVVDTEIREVEAPDFTAPQVQIGTPAVFRATTARAFQAMRSDPARVPTADREFRRTDRLLLRFNVFGPGESKPAVTARILNRAGGAMSPLTVQPSGDGATCEIDLPLAGLVSGEYLVEIKAKGADSEATELVPVRIVA